MAIELLLILVIGGIAAVAALLHLLGLSQTARLADEACARDVWRSEFPDAAPLSVTLSDDHGCALVETKQGLGLIWPMGADHTARFLHGARPRLTRTGLRVDLPDFTAPHLSLSLSSAQAAQWLQKIEAQYD